MSNVRDTRESEIIRRYLECLPDSPGNAKAGSRSIESVAEEWQVPAEDLRRYRDGNEGAIPASTRAAWVKLLGTGVDMDGLDLPDEMVDYAGGLSRSFFSAVDQAIQGDRLKKYQLYDQMEACRPEVSAALGAWAELAVTGSVGEDMRHAGGFEPEGAPGTGRDLTAVLNSISNRINSRLMPSGRKVESFRAACKFGQDFYELGLGVEGGRHAIVKLASRNPRTMWAHRGKNGKIDPKRAWKQILPGQLEPVAWFESWQVAQFALKRYPWDLDGTSILDAGRRKYVEIEAMEQAMVIRRLERASMRYLHRIGVGHMDEPSKKKWIKDYTISHTKQRTVDSNGAHGLMRITMPAGKDLILPVTDKNDPSDVKVLEGDASIADIADVRFLHAGWLSALGPPKAHLGFEDEVMRSTIGDLHVVWARKVRQAQLKWIETGLNPLVWISLLLRGIDPRTTRYTIFPPGLGTRDELIRAQVQLSHATTVKYLADAFGQSGEMPSIPWLLKYVMGLDSEVIDDLELVKVIDAKANAMKNPPNKGTPEDFQMGAAALGNPVIAEQRDHLRWMLEEKALAKRLPSAAARLGTLADPFQGEQFDEVCRSLGVRELIVA